MVTKKKPITFYADEDVETWYNALPSGQGGKIINDAICRGMLRGPAEPDASGTTARLAALARLPHSGQLLEQSQPSIESLSVEVANLKRLARLQSMDDKHLYERQLSLSSIRKDLR